MGLDAYGVTVAVEFAGDCQVDIVYKDENDRPYAAADVNAYFAHWKNFYQLQDWMGALYAEKSGDDGCFNNNTVRLTLADLARLEAALQTTEFAAMGDGDEIEAESMADTLDFIQRAREAIASGYAVFYDCWW